MLTSNQELTTVELFSRGPFLLDHNNAACWGDRLVAGNGPGGGGQGEENKGGLHEKPTQRVGGRRRKDDRAAA